MFELIWPTKKKLKGLRKHGIFPYSHSVLRMLVLLIVIFFLSKNYYNPLEVTDQLLSYLLTADEPFKFSKSSFRAILFKYLIAPAGMVIFLVVLVTLAMSRFNLNFKNVSFSLRRLFRFGRGRMPYSNRLGSFFCYIIITALFVILALFVGFNFFTDFSALLDYPESKLTLLRMLSDLGNSIMLIVISLIPAIYLARWLLFRIEHRMSAAELLRDSDFSEDEMIAKVE